LHFEDDDNGGDQDKKIRDIEDSFAELNISGIENGNDMESSIDEEYTYIIQSTGTFSLVSFWFQFGHENPLLSFAFENWRPHTEI
jgi:hypothetical protein